MSTKNLTEDQADRPNRYTAVQFARATVVTADWLSPYPVQGADDFAFKRLAGQASVVLVVEHLFADLAPVASEQTRSAALTELLRGGLAVKIHAPKSQAAHFAAEFAKRAPYARVFLANSAGLFQRVAA